jgi:hypothetical protein
MESNEFGKINAVACERGKKEVVKGEKQKEFKETD